MINSRIPEIIHFSENILGKLTMKWVIKFEQKQKDKWDVQSSCKKEINIKNRITIKYIKNWIPATILNIFFITQHSVGLK